MTNSSELLEAAIADLKLKTNASKARASAIESELSIADAEPLTESGARQLCRVGYVFEVQGLEARHAQVTPEADASPVFRLPFQSAASCWLTLAIRLRSIDSTRVQLERARGRPPLVAVSEEVGFDSANGELLLAFHLAVTSLLAERSAEARLHLRKFSLEAHTTPGAGSWLDMVVENVVIAFVALVRKAGGWSDIEMALGAINKLKEAQATYEDSFIESRDGFDTQTRAAMGLVGYYNLAQMVMLVGEYLKAGEGGLIAVDLSLDRHRRQALEAFRSVGDGAKAHFADLLWAGCRELTRNALWSHLEGLPQYIRSFGERLINRDDPVLELWPSQQEALRKNFLDPYPRAILVEMPTSAGKTLMAKFAIAQTKAFNPVGTVTYVVPTRALVNQITFDLRQDFPAARIEMAVPAFEIDPSEASLLGEGVDILVTTPEKLDLLIRLDHPSVRELSLIVADEAHNLGEGTRGARLELLLGTIRRERRDARFLLLSPFVPNGDELTRWLGGNRSLTPIRVNWRPSMKMVAAITASGRGDKRCLVLETLPASDNTEIDPGHEIQIGTRESVPGSPSTPKLSTNAAIAMTHRGGILILCRGKRTAVTRAGEIAGRLPVREAKDDLRDAVVEYVAAEAGYKPALVEYIRRGVAYHHAGLSNESRWLIESLIRQGDVSVVCGTTTLAQGVNFPISTVIVESLKKGDETLSYSDFWNIAGRAGRTLVDTLGVVAFPTPDAKQKSNVTEFLGGEAEQIVSQLTRVLIAVDEIGSEFTLKSLREWPELSALLQFLAHAVRVAKNANLADEIEDVLRSSLIYHQAAKQTSTDQLNKFINLCRTYVKSTASKKGLLALADRTGFATPSVFYLVAQTNGHRDLQDPKAWSPEVLFARDTSALKKRIELISGVPEMRLGDGSGGPLDTERTAKIIRDWVNGASLSELTTNYARTDATAQKRDKDKQVAEFSSYLFSTLIANASWGLGALEGVCLGGQEVERIEVDHVPSMVYFGVRTTEAVWMRMIGVPRIVAEPAAALWRAQKRPAPKNYDDLRSWVSNLRLNDWAGLVGSRPSLSAQSIQTVWRRLSGVAAQTANNAA